MQRQICRLFNYYNDTAVRVRDTNALIRRTLFVLLRVSTFAPSTKDRERLSADFWTVRSLQDSKRIVTWLTMTLRRERLFATEGEKLREP